MTDALEAHDRGDRYRSAVGTIVGAIGAVAVATGLLFTFGISPIQNNLSTLTALRESDRRELRDIYSTLSSLGGLKDITGSRFEEQQRINTRLERDTMHNTNILNERATAIANISQVDARLARLTDRFNETQMRLSPSVSDEIKELRQELREINKRIGVK